MNRHKLPNPAPHAGKLRSGWAAWVFALAAWSMLALAARADDRPTDSHAPVTLGSTLAIKANPAEPLPDESPVARLASSTPASTSELRLIIPGLNDGARLDAASLSDAPTDHDFAEPPKCQLWLVNVRCMDCCEFEPKVEQWECGAGWRPRTLDAFLATDSPDTVTVIFIHGNDNTAEYAKDQGGEFYRRMCRPNCCAAPMRFVLWSWPSDFVFGTYRHDVRLKASMVDAQGFHFARFLATMRKDIPISIIGHSFGSPIAAAGLHLLGGGSLCGKVMEFPTPFNRGPTRLIYFAPAMPSYSFAAGHHYGKAISQVDRFYMTYNSQDMVLQLYPRLPAGRARGPSALGYTGFLGAGTLGELRHRIFQTDIYPYIKKEHNFRSHMGSPPVLNRVWREAMFLTGAPQVDDAPISAPNDSAPAPPEPEENGDFIDDPAIDNLDAVQLNFLRSMTR